jgi:8-oxo-dGTP pyrophosphatase MutT (NUDIX family)
MSELIPCVGGVVINPAGFLLVVQRKNEPARGLWSLPGGRVEHGETAEVAVVREVTEETGIFARVLWEPCSVQLRAVASMTFEISSCSTFLTVRHMQPMTLSMLVM